MKARDRLRTTRNHAKAHVNSSVYNSPSMGDKQLIVMSSYSEILVPADRMLGTKHVDMVPHDPLDKLCNLNALPESEQVFTPSGRYQVQPHATVGQVTLMNVKWLLLSPTKVSVAGDPDPMVIAHVSQYLGKGDGVHDTSVSMDVYHAVGALKTTWCAVFSECSYDSTVTSYCYGSSQCS